MSIKGITLFIAVIVSLTTANANVPIIVSAGAGKRVAMSLSNKAEKQLENGDVAGAKLSVDAALHADPKFWPALYQRAEIFAMQGKYDLAIQDCNEALRQYPTFVDASLLRAIKDAKAACSIAEWRDENTIDTLAAAYAETGDFDSAVRYAAQALAVKGITPVDQKHIRRHPTLFQQHQPVRL